MQCRASRPVVSEPVSERAVPASRLIDLTCVRPKQVWSGDRNGLNSLPLISSGRNLRSTGSARETTEAVGKSFLIWEDQGRSCSSDVAGRDQGGAVSSTIIEREGLAPSYRQDDDDWHRGRTARHQADSRDHALSVGASGRGSVSRGRARLGFGIRQVLFKHVDVPDIVPSDLGGPMVTIVFGLCQDQV